MLHLHFAVFLFGVAGVLGKLVHADSQFITLGRTFFGALALAFLLKSKRARLITGNTKDQITLIILGTLLAFHWTAFFEAIALSSVAIGILSFSSFPFFVIFLEPLVKKSRISKRDLIAAVVTILGVALVPPEWKLGSKVTMGVAWGLASGASFAILVLANERLRATYDPIFVAFQQNFFAFAALSAVTLPDAFEYVNQWNIMLVAVLGIICTGVAHTLFIFSLANVRVSTASIITALEPVYGIILGVTFLGEAIGFKTIIGGTLIVGSAVWLSLLEKSRPS